MVLELTLKIVRVEPKFALWYSLMWSEICIINERYFDVVVRGPLNFWVLVPIAYAGVLLEQWLAIYYPGSPAFQSKTRGGERHTISYQFDIPTYFDWSFIRQEKASLFLPDEGDHSIIETLQQRFWTTLSSACPNIELEWLWTTAPWPQPG